MAYKKVVLLKTSGETSGYDTPNEAIDAASSGDLVIIYPGTYSSTIIIKDNVDIHCIGRVTLTSTNINGTLWDGGMQANISLFGFPTITNSNGLNKRINFGHPSSSVSNFWWELRGRINRPSAGSGSFSVISSNLGADLTLVDQASPDTFYLSAQSSNALPSSKTLVDFVDTSIITRVSDEFEATTVYVEDNKIKFKTIQADAGSPGGPILSSYRPLIVRVYP